MPRKSKTVSGSALAVRIGRNIKNARTLLGMTQGQLAEVLDLENVTVSRIETGAQLPSIDRLDEMAKALKVSLTALLPHEQEHRDGRPAHRRHQGLASPREEVRVRLLPRPMQRTIRLGRRNRIERDIHGSALTAKARVVLLTPTAFKISSSPPVPSTARPRLEGSGATPDTLR
jgi:transcriptional regulator with XRE-family HTH domain